MQTLNKTNWPSVIILFKPNNKIINERDMQYTYTVIMFCVSYIYYHNFIILFQGKETRAKIIDLKYNNKKINILTFLSIICIHNTI